MSENSPVIPVEKFNLSPLHEMPLPESFDAALALFDGDVTTAATELPDDFPAIDKDKLVNRPFLALGWTLSRPAEKDGSQYLVVRGITPEGKRFRFSDGGTGIFAQLVSLTRRRIETGHPFPNAGLMCENGLRKSDYVITGADGKPQDATTYYINNEA